MKFWAPRRGDEALCELSVKLVFAIPPAQRKSVGGRHSVTAEMFLRLQRVGRPVQSPRRVDVQRGTPGFHFFGELIQKRFTGAYTGVRALSLGADPPKGAQVA